MDYFTFYKPERFLTQELVPEDIYNELGERSLILLDPRILFTLDQIRNYFGKSITINTWKQGGSFSQRGFRVDLNTGAKYSQHRFGRAIDFDVEGHTAEEVRQEIIKRQSNFKFITTMELNTSWVHIDCRNYNNVKGIQLINP